MPSDAEIVEWVLGWCLLQSRGIPITTSAAALAQVGRGGSRQAVLARILTGVKVIPLDQWAGQQTGELLGVSRTRDVIDAHIAIIADRDDMVLTSDPDDIARLAGARDVRLAIIRA